MSLPLSRVNRNHLAVAIVIGLVLFTPSVSAKPGDLVASPSFIDLGSLPVGVNGEADFTLTNNTDHTIDISGVNINQVNVSPLSVIATGPCLLPPGGTCTLPVFMGPASVGPAVLRVRWRAGSVASNWVIVAATGVAP
jgi:hypothetical protein